MIIATVATAADKKPPTYQKGTITGFNTMMQTAGGGGPSGSVHSYGVKVYELRGTDSIYTLHCLGWKVAKFTIGQTMDYRTDGDKFYVHPDNEKESRCVVVGARALDNAKPAEGAKPSAPTPPAPTAAPSAKPDAAPQL